MKKEEFEKAIWDIAETYPEGIGRKCFSSRVATRDSLDEVINTLWLHHTSNNHSDNYIRFWLEGWRNDVYLMQHEINKSKLPRSEVIGIIFGIIVYAFCAYGFIHFISFIWSHM